MEIFYKKEEALILPKAVSSGLSSIGENIPDFPQTEPKFSSSLTAFTAVRIIKMRGLHKPIVKLAKSSSTSTSALPAG
jgi:hypothetical protein